MKEEGLRIERKREERERWWSGADFFKLSPQNDCIDESENRNELDFIISTKKSDKYNSDYSRWEQWVPSDPATLEEATLASEIEDKLENEEFEKNNSEFCDQMLRDINDRNRAKKKKQDSADIARLKGNRLFKKKDFESALNQYMESLKVLPYDVRTLINIAQVTDCETIINCTEVKSYKLTKITRYICIFKGLLKA